MSITDFNPEQKTGTSFSLKASSKNRFNLLHVLQPLSLEKFMAEYWEQKPLLLKRDTVEYYDDLFRLEDLDYIISSTDLRYPAVRMVKDGKSLPLSTFAEDVRWGDDVYHGTIIPEKLLEQYQKGASVVFQALHRAWKPLGLFCRDLEKQLHHFVQTNLYLTPKLAQGFKPHYDTHDVFVLQITGSKIWKIYQPPIELPHRSQPSDNARLAKEIGQPLMEFTLEAGDMLYLPRGFVHEALTSQEESLHITVGITTFTYIDLLTEVMNDATQSIKKESAFRRSLPVGFEMQVLNPELKSRFLELITSYINETNFEDIARRLQDRFINNRYAILDGQLTQLSRLENLDIQQSVMQRPGNVYRVYKSGDDKIILEFSSKKISFPDYVEPSLRFILDQNEQPFMIAEIPGELDNQGKIVLVRRLVNETFLTLV